VGIAAIEQDWRSFFASLGVYCFYLSFARKIAFTKRGKKPEVSQINEHKVARDDHFLELQPAWRPFPFIQHG
jgi:hypothetical protein